MTDRLFLAIPIRGDIAQATVEWRSKLDLPGRPVPAENLHVTLRYIGDVDGLGRDKVAAGVDQIEKGPPFGIRINGLGAFPRATKATVVWAGLRSDGELEHLAGLVDHAVAGAGLGHEERPFHPHLTLTRIRPPVSVDTSADGPGLSMPVEGFALFRSVVAPGGVTYDVLERFSLR